MDKKPALILTLLITLLISINFYFITSSKEIPKESVILSRVIDGDTLEIIDKNADKRTIRLININTPEKSETGYNEAKSFLSRFENKTISIEKLETDKYKRTLARIYFLDEYINLEIIRNGLANKFLVRESEKSLFDKAESEAIKNSKGLWKKSSYFDCLSASVNKKEEFVRITNLCSKINLNGFSIKDESRKIYYLKNITLDEGEQITLHTRQGNDTQQDIFWNSKTEIWNDDADSIYIKDNENNLIFYKSDGY